MKKNKPVLIAGIILVVVAIVIVLGTVILGNYIEGELQNRQVGQYRVQTSEADVNIFLRRITINDVIVEDSAANQKFTSPETKASGIHIFPLVFNNEVVINKLLIQQPEITVMQRESDNKPGQKRDTSPEDDREIKRIRIKQLEIANAAVLLQKQASGNADTLLSLQAGIEIRNLNIFSDQEQLTFKRHSAEKLEVRLTNGVYPLPGGLYKLHFGSLGFSTEQKTLSLENFHLSSLHSKYNIAKQTGAETDWYDISMKHFELVGINLDALLQDTAIVFRKALLEELNATIFRDKRPPFPDKPDSKLPMEMLESLSFPIHSDSILIKNATVVYEEHAEESTETGNVTFNRMYATIYNLSTIQDSIKGQTAMSVRAAVMNEALLKVEFIFPNNEYSYKYQASGSLEPLELTAFNPMLVPAAFVRVKEGRIKGLDFDFTYDENNSEGSLSLEYENLDISLLDKKDGSQKKFKTFITETFILSKENLKENNSYKEGTISAEREKKKSIFNYWWKSLFSGIKDVLAF